MMEGAFFVGRKAILTWINDFLDINISKVEETASGCVACSMTDSLFPNCVNMKKVNWAAKHEHEFVGNYKVLQDGLKKAGVSKVVPVQQLIRAKYQVRAREGATERRQRDARGGRTTGAGAVHEKEEMNIYIGACGRGDMGGTG